MTTTLAMNDDLLDNYNPLYDVHLRQYFAMPHMQRHLRSIGLLGDISYENGAESDQQHQHHTVIDKILRNREAELHKYADLQRKLHVAEKIELCRRIRSGTASSSDCHRAKPSRSLSRGRSRVLKKFQRQRSSTSTDDKDLVKRIEAENEEPMYENPTLVYNRLSTNIHKYRYLHKLDDETLALYMEQLRRQLSRLERFRQVSFGPFSVARHQNDPQVSWFFRRRSLPTLTESTPTTTTIAATNTTTITPSTTHSNFYEQSNLRVTRTEAKKTSQEGAAAPTAHRIAVSKKMKSEIDSEITSVKGTFPTASESGSWLMKESAERRGPESPLNPNDSSLNTLEFLDSQLEGTASEVLQDCSAESTNGENKPPSNLSQNIVEELKIKAEKNPNLTIDLYPGIAKDETDLPMIISQEIYENQEEAENELETKNEREGLLEGEISTDDREFPLITHIYNQQEERCESDDLFTELPTEELKIGGAKVTAEELEKSYQIESSPTGSLSWEGKEPFVSEGDLLGKSFSNVSVKAIEMINASDCTFRLTKTASQEVTSDKTNGDVNEFVSVNQKILIASSEGKNEDGSDFTSEIDSVDRKKQIVAVEAELVKDRAAVSAGLVFSTEKHSLSGELEVCSREVDFSDDEKKVPDDFVEPETVASERSQCSEKQISESLPMLPVSMPMLQISVTDNEISELSKSDYSFEQVQYFTENKYDVGHYSERIGIANSRAKDGGVESTEDGFEVGKVSDSYVDNQLKRQKKDMSAGRMVDGRSETRTQQMDAEGNVLESNYECPPDKSPLPSITQSDAYSVENSYLQQEVQEIGSEMKLPEETRKRRVGIDSRNVEVHEVSDIVDSESEIQKLVQYMENSKHDDTLFEGSENETKSEIKPEILEAITAEKVREAVLLNPENLITEGITSKLKSVIYEIRESEPSVSLRNIQKSDEVTGYLSEEKGTTYKLKSTKSDSGRSKSNEDSVVTTNEVIPEMDSSIRKRIASETIESENLKKTSVSEKSGCIEEIPKIVVFGDDTTLSNVEKMEKVMVQCDTEVIKEAQVGTKDGGAFDQQMRQMQSTISMKQSKNEDEIASHENNVTEQVNDGKQLVRGQLNEFLEQYMQDMIKNAAQLAETSMRASKTSEVAEEIEVQKIADQPISEFSSQFLVTEFPRESESRETLQKQAENLHLQCDIPPPSMLKPYANDSDENTEASESCETTEETRSNQYHTDGREDCEEQRCLQGEIASDVERGIPPRQAGGEEFPVDTSRVITLVEGYIEKLEENKGRLKPVSLDHCIISGLNATGQLILNSTNDPTISSNSDKNGSKEWDICAMENIPSDVDSEPNICPADINANISGSEGAVQIKSTNHEEMGENSTLTDKRLLVKSITAGTEEC